MSRFESFSYENFIDLTAFLTGSQNLRIYFLKENSQDTSGKIWEI